MAYSCQVRAVHQNKGWHGIQWGLMFRDWYLQAFVGKTDKCKRPLSGRLTKLLDKAYLSIDSLKYWFFLFVKHFLVLFNQILTFGINRDD